MTELCKLATKHGTDKIHYTPFYSLLLEGKRDQIHSVLEVGIGTPAAMAHVPGYKPGASLRMWRDYFPNAYVYGIDKDPAALVVDARVDSFLADQTDIGSLTPLIDRHAPFDLIVDDGSHSAADQLATLGNLSLFLRTDGIYIIEDADVKGGLLQDIKHFPYSYVQVRGSLTGHCVVIRG